MLHCVAIGNFHRIFKSCGSRVKQRIKRFDWQLKILKLTKNNCAWDYRKCGFSPVDSNSEEYRLHPKVVQIFSNQIRALA
jgi:hypothetical protein